MDTYEKKYKEALGWMQSLYDGLHGATKEDAEHYFPELKESEDEKIRKELITHCRNIRCVTEEGAEGITKWIAWLEKQGETNETINRDKFAQGILRGAAINLITWIDYNVAEGNMCLSNMECKDIEDSLVNGDWNKIYAYIKKKLEKQGEQKSFDYENANIQQKDFAPKENTPRYSIGDVLCDKSCTTLNKESQPNFEITDIRNGMYICDKCSFPISQQDEYELVAKRIEQKSADTVEPKFKVGDWITFYDGKPFKILKVESEQNGILDYLLLSQNGYDSYYNKKYVDENARLWTIQDAKDGDVLVNWNNNIYLFKGIEEEVVKFHCYYSTNHEEFNIPFNNNSHLGLTEPQFEHHPATKEQCDLLFQKMKEAGYECNAEKKPTWSEEDECYMVECINAIATKDGWSFEEKRKTKHWLKSLKDRIQPKQE